MGYILQIQEMDLEDKTEHSPTPAALKPLLQKYAEIFKESEKLPPPRKCDHKIVFFMYINLIELYDTNDGWLGCNTLT